MIVYHKSFRLGDLKKSEKFVAEKFHANVHQPKDEVKSCRHNKLFFGIFWNFSAASDFEVESLKVLPRGSLKISSKFEICLWRADRNFSRRKLSLTPESYFHDDE